MKAKKSPDSIYQHIVEGSIAGYIAFRSSDYKCVYTNSSANTLIAYDELFGSKESGPEDLDVKKLFPKVDLNKAKELGFTPLNFNILINEGFYQAILVNRGTSQQFVANVGVKKMQIDGEDHVLLMIQDTTIQTKLQREVLQKQNEIKSAYEELVSQNEQLKALDKAKDRFIALMTHELRTPASAMLATADVLKEGLYDTPEELKEFVEMIHDQGIHLVELINDVLDFSKLQAGKMDYYIEQLNLVELVKDQVDFSKASAEQLDITLNYDIKETEAICYYDSLRLRQVLNNVLSNAVKYNKKSGSVNVKIEQHTDRIKLSVTDTGKGIPKEHIERVFDEFETLGNVSLHHQGTGLGMPISKQMIEAMGGSITIESEVGVGSTFTITIPTKKVLAEELYRERLEVGGDLFAS